MSSNRPYEEESGVINTSIRIGLAGGAGYGIYKYKKDPENFKRRLTKVINSVSVMTPTNKGATQDAAEEIYTAIKGTSAEAAERSQILKEARYANEEKILSSLEFAKFEESDDVMTKSVTNFYKKKAANTSIVLKNKSEIVDMHGNNLVEGFEDFVKNKLGGTRVRSSVSGKDTVLKISFARNGKMEELNIPIAVKSKVAKNAYVTKVGDAIYSEGMNLDYVFDKETNKITGVLSDPNTKLLDILNDEEKTKIYFDDAKSGKNKVAELVERTINKEMRKSNAAEVVKNASSVRDFNDVIKAFKKTLLWGPANDVHRMEIAGAKVNASLDSLEMLNRELPGAGEALFSTPNIVGKNGYIGANMGRTIDWLDNVRKDPSSYLKVARYERLAAGKSFTTAINPVNISNLSTSVQDTAMSLAENLSLSLSQSQTSDKAMSASPHINDAYAVDEFKARKGLMFERDPATIRFRGHNGLAVNSLSSNVRTAPISWNESIEGAMPTMRNFRERGMMNLLGVIDPFSSDEISLNKSLMNKLNVVESKEFVLDEIASKGVNISYLQNGKYKTTDNLHDFLRNNLHNVEEFSIEHGSPLGRLAVTDTLYGENDWERIKRSEGVVDRLNSRFVANRDDILNMMANGYNEETGSFKLIGKTIDRPVKGGNAMGRMRASLRFGDTGMLGGLYNFLTEESGLTMAPEARISFNNLKNMMLKEVGTKSISGKGRGDYVQLLKELTLGHLEYARKDGDVIIQDDMLKLMSKYVKGINPNAKKFNITQFANKKGITFNTSAVGIDEQILDFQRMFASARESFISGNKTIAGLDNESSVKTINKTWQFFDSLSKNGLAHLELELSQKHGIKSLDDLVNFKGQLPFNAREYILPTLFSFAPHEAARSTLGPEFGTMRITSQDMPYMLGRKEVMSALGKYNLIDSTSKMTQGYALSQSLSGKFDREMLASLEKELGGKIPIIETGEEAQALLGDIWGKGGEMIQDLQSPESYMESFLANEKNKFGFVLKHETEGALGYTYIPGKDYYAGAQYLEEGKVAVLEAQKQMALAVNSAANHGGIITENDYRKFSLAMNYHMAGPKTGLLREAALQIEGTQLVKHISDDFLIKSLEMSKLKEIAKSSLDAKNLEFTLGNVTLMNHKDFTSRINRDLKDALTISEEKNITLLDYLNQRHGENNYLSDLVNVHQEKLKTALDANVITELEYRKALNNTEAISNLGAQRSQTQWQRIQEDITQEIKSGTNKFEAISRRIQNNFIPTLVRRDPTLYQFNMAMSYGFVGPDISEGRTSVLGSVLRTLTGEADTDGDAIRQFMLYERDVKAATIKEIEADHRMANEFMYQIKERNALKIMMDGNEKASFAAVSESFAGRVAEQAKLLEREQALASLVTKGITGIATIKSNTIKGYYEGMATKLGLSKEELDPVRMFLNTVIPLKIPQNVISAKHSEAVLTENGLSKIGALIETIGKMDEETISNSIKSLGGLHPTTMFTTIEAMKPRYNMNSEFLEDVASLYDIETNWRQVSEEKVKRMHARGWAGQNMTGDEYYQHYLNSLEQSKAEMESVLGEGKQFFSQMEGFEKMGLSNRSLLDIQAEAINKSSASDNLDTLFINARRSWESGKKETPFLYELSTAVRESNAWKALGVSPTLPNWARPETYREGVKRTFPFVEKALTFIGENMTKGRIAGAAAGIVALSAGANLMFGGDDGTPNSPNDIPSVNNPSFHNTQYNDLNHSGSIYSNQSTNLSMDLLTDNQNSLVSKLGSLVGARGYNSVSVVHDGSNPYKSEMYKYS